MTRGTRLAMAFLLLGASPLASCTDAAVSAQDAIALRVVAALHAQHLPPATLATIDRVFGIERRIGARLLARHAKGMQLTHRGRELARHLGAMETTASEVERHLFGKDNKMAGPVRIAVTDGLATFWLMPQLIAFNRSHPAVRVEIATVNSWGDLAVEVVHRPGHGVTVSTMFRAVTTDRTLLPRLLAVPDLVPEARTKAEVYVRDLERGAEDPGLLA